MLLSAITILTFLVSLSLALVHGVDSSTLISEATWVKVKSEGFTKAVIRGYEEACGVGGMVDPNFVLSYKNARAAGITDIDAYWLYVDCSHIYITIFQLTHILVHAQVYKTSVNPMLLRLLKFDPPSRQTR